MPRPASIFSIEPLAVSRRIAAGLLVTVLILGLTAGLMYQAHERIVSDVGSVARTHVVSERLDAVLAAMADAETGQRGYLLTGEDAYLDPYHRAALALPEQVRELEALLAGDSTQLARLAKLDQLTRDKLAELERTVHMHRSGDTRAALVVVRDGAGKAVMEAIRTQVTEMQRSETSLADHRNEELREAVDDALRLGLLGLTWSFGFLLLMYALIRREAKRRRSGEREIEQSNRRLAASLEQTEALARALTVLARMGELLQSSRALPEAYEIIRRMLPELLPGTSGALSMINPSQTIAETLASWGEQPASMRTVFAPDECWALRRGRLHSAQDTGSVLSCPHLSGEEPGATAPAAMCVPLIAYGETLGVLTVCSTGDDDVLGALRRTARGAGEQISLALANLRLQETLRSLSIRDPLTGVFNRRFMEASLERELARARRARHSLGVLMIDIDHFKPFNDTHGHEAGDVLLAGFGELLRRSFREDDIVCRYGGEEFLVILPGSPLAQTHARALALCEAVRKFEPYYERRPLGHITVSVGVASCPEDGVSDEVLVRAADAALYRAKHDGRDRVVLAGDLPVRAATAPPVN